MDLQLLDKRNPKAIASLLPALEWLYRYYFRVTTDGWKHLSTVETALLVGSHNGGLVAPDIGMFMVDWCRRFGTERPVYGLMQPEVFHSPRTAQQVARFGAIPARPKFAIAALRRNASVLVFPGGARDLFRPHSERYRIELAGRKGFIKLALREGVPIVPLISVGIHDTLIILTDCHQQIKQLKAWGIYPLAAPWEDVFPIYLGLPWGIGCGAMPHIPLPVQVHTRVCPPISFKHTGREAANDRAYVEECYERVRTHMQASLDDLVRTQNRW